MPPGASNHGVDRDHLTASQYSQAKRAAIVSPAFTTGRGSNQNGGLGPGILLLYATGGNLPLARDSGTSPSTPLDCSARTLGERCGTGLDPR